MSTVITLGRRLDFGFELSDFAFSATGAEHLTTTGLVSEDVDSFISPFSVVVCLFTSGADFDDLAVGSSIVPMVPPNRGLRDLL